MSEGVRYTMIPEFEWESTKVAFSNLSAIGNDWRDGIISAGEAMAAITLIVETARSNSPNLARGSNEKATSD